MATYVDSTTAKKIGHDTAGFNISRSSIKQKREINRKNFIAEAIEQVPSVGLCFDIKASNTGIHSGACANIQ